MSHSKHQHDNRKHHEASNYHWNYDPDGGPDDWPNHYPVGKYQSPINIIVGCDPSQLSASCCCESSESTGQESSRSESLDLEHRISRLKVHEREGNHRKRVHLNSIEEDEGSSSSTESCEHHHHHLDNELSTSGASKSHTTFTSTLVSTGRKRCEGMHVQNTRHCVTNKKIFLGYPRYMNSMKLCNTGHNWQINFAPEIKANTLLSGPPFGDREFRLAQLHCHWGESCDSGSEHQINGKSFAAELHFVHWNCSQYKDPIEASKHKHGLAVLGVLVQAVDGEQNRHRQLDKIISGLPRIQEPEAEATIAPKLDLKKLFPGNKWVYATYEGSLTTPPLSEVVDWLVFLSPIICSTSQIEQFKQIKCPTSGKTKQLIKNCRPVQPLNGRLVSIWTRH